MTRPTTGITKKPMMPKTPPSSRVRLETPARLRLRPGTRYLAANPSASTTVAAMPTVQPAAPAPLNRAHTMTPAQHRSRPGSMGMSTPKTPITTATPAMSETRPLLSVRSTRTLCRTGGGSALRVSSADDLLERRGEVLGALHVRGVAAAGVDDLAVGAAGRRVPVEDRPGLADHRLRRAGVVAGPAGHQAELAQLRQVEERAVGDDRVLVAADPGDRRLDRRVDDAGEV